jgi:PQQ-like domain
MGRPARYRLDFALADTIYWSNYEFNDYTIRCAPLGGGGTVDTLYSSAQGVNIALGLAIDAATGQLYWTNYGDDTIRRAPLAGGGSVDTLYGPAQGVSDPFGLAIHPAAGRIYWTNGEWDQGVGGTIRRAPLAGGGTVDTLYSPANGVSGPSGLAIDPAAGRIYWGNSATATISRAPLAGGGGVDPLYSGSQGVAGPIGLAVEPAAGRIYWTNYTDSSVRGAPLAGGGTVDTLYGSSQAVRSPGGVAVDPDATGLVTLDLGIQKTDRFAVGDLIGRAIGWVRDVISRPPPPKGRIYWANRVPGWQGGPPTASDNTIRGAPLAGGGQIDNLYGSAQGVTQPNAVAVLRAPVPAGAPVISWALIIDDGPFGDFQFGGGSSGPLNQRLTCSRGTWAPDLVGSFLYRAPQSIEYQWRLNGTDIGGANQRNYTATAPGSYTCRVTATNRAGSASQTSAAVTIS